MINAMHEVTRLKIDSTYPSCLERSRNSQTPLRGIFSSYSCKSPKSAAQLIEIIVLLYELKIKEEIHGKYTT